MFPKKCQGLNDRTHLGQIESFCEHLDSALYVTIKLRFFNCDHFFRFLCLINSLYKRCVSCMYNVSYLSPISPMCPMCFIYSIHCVIRSYVLGLLYSYSLCRISSSHRCSAIGDVCESDILYRCSCRSVYSLVHHAH